MARTISTPTYDALAASSSKIIHLVKIELGTYGGVTATPKYTDNAIETVDGSDTYEPTELFVDITRASQSGSLSNSQLTITVSLSTNIWMGYMLNYPWHNGAVYYSLAAVDDSYGIVGSPVLLFKGLLSNFSATEGSEPLMTLTADSHWADFEKKAGRRTNKNSQQEYFSTDDGMNFSAESVKDLSWGRG
tara:strand:+ start:6391 stop:6960 length:570 start_codon:yes stop_codon:yes gene_type:complete